MLLLGVLQLLTRGRHFTMFKWTCLAVATLGLAAFLWMVNDMRLEVRRIAEPVNQHLPPILKNTEQAAEQVNQHLPTILNETEQSITALAEMTEDIQQFKELFGTVHTANQNKDLATQANGVLDLIDEQQATIGLKPSDESKELKNTLPAQQWARGARRNVPLLSVIARSQGDLFQRLATSRSGQPWYIKIGEKAPQLLSDWIRANPPASKDPD
jgi:hypothetical protein